MTITILVFAIGNELHGDDAVAPLLVRQLQKEYARPQIEFMESSQLRGDHVADLLGRSAVLFIDADMSCDAPFRFSEITAVRDNSSFGHVMTPFTLLYSYRQLYEADVPNSFLMRIRGYSFDKGETLSKEASENLHYAAEGVRAWLTVQTEKGGAIPASRMLSFDYIT